MKRVVKLTLIILLVLFLGGCGSYYKEVNERIKLINPEEDGYIFFSGGKKIDGDNIVDLEERLKEIIDDNNVKREYLVYNYNLVNDLLHFRVNIKRDKNDIVTTVIIVLDVNDLELKLFDVYEIVEGYQTVMDNFNNVYVDDPKNDITVKYQYDNGVYVKEEHPLGWFDLEDHEKIVNEFIKNGSTYLVDGDYEMIELKKEDGVIYFESNYLELFDKSRVGGEIGDYATKLNKTMHLLYTRIKVINNELFIIYKFAAGFLMNTSLLGSTNELVFRLDFKTKQLKYIAELDGLVTIYTK